VVPAVFTVTTTADSGDGSLRQAIIGANVNPGADTIAFALPDSEETPGLNGSGVSWWRIQTTSPLPPLSDTVSVDGWSQAGAGPGLAPTVMLDGSQAGSVNTALSLGRILLGAGVSNLV
jgi:hypothetical protein